MREYAFDAHQQIGRGKMVGVRMRDQQITAGRQIQPAMKHMMIGIGRKIDEQIIIDERL